MATLDLAALKSYVTGGAPRVLHANTCLLDVEHSLIQQRFKEIPFDLQAPIAEIKRKVYGLCGSKEEYQRLSLVTSSSRLVLDDDNRSLSSYGVNANSAASSYLFVEDLDPYALGRGGALHDVSLVDKYVMSDEDYNKRENTYRNFKAKQKALDPNWRPLHAAAAAVRAASSKQEPEEMEDEEVARQRLVLASRCEIRPGGRRGVISYVGPVPQLSTGGLWVGVSLDEPMGKHDGVVAGQRYFKCSAKHGTFVRTSRVLTGDFPERDPFDDEVDEETQESAADEEHEGNSSSSTNETSASVYEEL